VEAAQTGHGRGFLRARLERVVEPASSRVAPPCPYFGACGGCHYQHAIYEHQLEIKSAILRENLRRIGGIDWRDEISIHPSPEWNYRNRTRMQVMAGADFALAYFRFGSRVPLPIERCPISSELINRAIAAITAVGRREHPLPAGIREIEFFADD